MNLNTLLDLAIMIFAGMFCGRMAKHVHLPNVTGYLVAGLLIGPSVFGLLSEDFLTTINIISDVALGFIAFSIGNEFKMSYFKRVGVAPIVIACLESLFAVVFVVLGLLDRETAAAVPRLCWARSRQPRLLLRPSWSSSSTARRAP